MTTPTAHVPLPLLEMRDGMPVSTAFDDVYFSRAGAVAETEHVFLRGNGLPARWQTASMDSDDDSRVAFHGKPEGRRVSAEGTKGTKRSLQGFTICELGFGTGLNFLVTMRAFRATAPVNAKLHYIAIEKFPFAPEALRALLSHQPELAHETELLLAAYPLRLPGIHRIHLGNVTLTLCFGDVLEMLNELGFSRGACPPYASLTPAATRLALGATHARTEDVHGHVNAWYLDGFSPAKNAQMWGEAIYQQMRRLSAPVSTFATFTAASHVRRGLEAVGFTVTKTLGFAHKREMSVGVLRVASPASSEEGVASGQSPVVSKCEAGTVVIIIGAGIAGATLARALAERGYRVTVLERYHVASGASGNRAGVLFPHITKQWGTSSAWYFTAYGYALRELQRWQAQGLAFTQKSCGMLRLPRNAEEEMVLTHMQETHGLDAGIVHWLPREAASAQAGVPLETGAAFFPQGTWLNPEQLCASLLQHAHITVREHSLVQSLVRRGDHWCITLASGEAIEAPICCITAAHESAVLLSDYGITLGSVGGQVSEFSGDNAAANLRSILCHSGYAIPLTRECVAEGEPRSGGVSSEAAKGGRPPSLNSYLVGATYHREDMLGVTAARHDENRAALSAIMPSMPALEIVSGRSSIRATTPDRMPYIGAIDTGLYVATGFGSRGLLSAPLAAEIIASEVASEMPPVTQALLHAVRPTRFMKS
ncbi:MAG: FAD-dependent 5-carboxymethylaminomethyl-2-thiouridine(34) oxidoreductase MnmC [Rickettsiales bacterium]|nr:FAD-dependent 5-carboxymethylaminomethyl-2-thiouridine(34) oxidoreductase MnmC [Rickettsiales bacterium]